MLRDEDLEAAIEAGIITEQQHAAMRELAAGRRKQRTFVRGREERFRLLGGFNDFFVAIGVILLGIGLMYGYSFGVQTNYSSGSWGLSYHKLAAWFSFAVLVMWALAELLTERARLVAPSIVIVIFLGLCAGMAGWAWTSLVMHGPEARIGSGVARFPGSLSFGMAFGAALGVVCLHYGRFRLPFSLFAIAVCLVLLAHVLVYAALIHVAKLVPIDAARFLSLLSLALGLGIFAWAMTFDTSDPERTSRRADCGFWLHLLAAPLIVHPLAGPLINHPLFPDYSATRLVVTGTTVTLVIALIAVLSIVALVIDRRALLVAGLGYLGAAMAYAMGQLATGAHAGLATLMLLGALIIVLGTGWHRLRAMLMRAIPNFPLKSSLPPYGVPT